MAKKVSKEVSTTVEEKKQVKVPNVDFQGPDPRVEVKDIFWTPKKK